MLSEHQLETIEKTFPDGCVAVWAFKKGKPEKGKKRKKFGIFVWNPQGNVDLDDIFKTIMGRATDSES